MFKGKTIASTMFGVFLLTLMATGIQIPTISVFAQDSEIESVNASNTGSGNTTSSPESDIESVNAVTSEASNATSTEASNATGTEASNATSVAKAAQAKPDAATVTVGDSFAQQGTVTSTQDPLPGHEAHQLALILPPRDDGAIYQGTFTYTASKPVEVVILENFSNESAVDPAYGSIATAPLGEGTVAISLLTPQYNSPINAASLPFAGNALALHTLNGDPFAATYTVTGDVEKPQTFNLINPPPVAEATQADAGDGDGKDGDNDGKDGDNDGKDGGNDGDGGDNDGKDGGNDGDGGGNDG
ncbi:MAG TPA: hypothetical protein VF084_03850, partial [Nitrososphaeraceae archaeon]